MISRAGTFARLSNMGKNIRLLAFFSTSEIWQFHRRVLAIVTPNTLTLFTRSSSLESTVIASNWCCVLLKSISISLHLSGFSWSLFVIDHCSTAVTATCIALCPPLWTTSVSVVSSTYFHISLHSLKDTQNNAIYFRLAAKPPYHRGLRKPTEKPDTKTP